MTHRFKNIRLASGLVAAACAVALVAFQAPAAKAAPPSIDQQLAAVGASSAGSTLESQLGALLASPDLPAMAQYILTSEGSTLTAFQQSALSLIPLVSADATALQDEMSGAKLSTADRKTLNDLKQQFNTNPAIKAIRQAGVQLQNSATLSSTLSSDQANLSLPVTDIPAGSGIPALDSFDATVSNFSNLANAPGLASQVASIMSSPAFAAYVRGLNPLVAAGAIPDSQLWALLLPNDHDPTTLDFVNWAGGLLLAFLGAVGAIIWAPTVGAAVFAFVLFTGTAAYLEFQFFATIDCDHDGDPWDAADVPGNEC